VVVSVLCHGARRVHLRGSLVVGSGVFLLACRECAGPDGQGGAEASSTADPRLDVQPALLPCAGWRIAWRRVASFPWSSVLFESSFGATGKGPVACHRHVVDGWSDSGLYATCRGCRHFRGSGCRGQMTRSQTARLARRSHFGAMFDAE